MQPCGSKEERLNGGKKYEQRRYGRAFIETEKGGQEAVDITTEIAGYMDGDNLIESIALADAEALKSIAQQLNRRPDDVYGAFIFHMTQQIQKNKERRASECTETS